MVKMMYSRVQLSSMKLLNLECVKATIVRFLDGNN